MKTILVPNDFSKNADNALQYAIALAKEKCWKVIILHTFQKAHDVFEIATKPKEEKLSSLCCSISIAHNIVCEFINIEGSLLDIIIDTIHKTHPDFVIMGTKGARGIKEILLGSNAERVIKKSKCPVIIVPKKESFKGIKNITYATNYYSNNSTNAIATMLELIEIAKIFSAQIHVVEVCDEECICDDVTKYMNAFKEKVIQASVYKKISFSLIFGNNEELRLEEFSKATSSNLLAISTQNRILVDRFFHAASETKAINRRSLPLMVLHHIAAHSNHLVFRQQAKDLLLDKSLYSEADQ